MNDEEIDNLIHQMIFSIPKDDNKSIISAYGSIDMDDLITTIRRLKKVPNINDLMKENKKLNKLKEYVNCRIEEFKNGGKSRKEIKAHQYYMLLCDIEKILNSSL